MPITVEVTEKTLQLLNKLQEELKAGSGDYLLKALISASDRILESRWSESQIEANFLER